MTKIRLKFFDVELTFKEWLKNARKKAYLSQESLGKKVGVSKQYISVLEKGEPHPLTNKPVTPKREIVEALARITGADLNQGLKLAGYASDIVIPEGFIVEGFEDLEQEDIDKIIEYIKLLKAVKRK